MTERAQPSAPGPLRLVATVTVPPEVVAEAIERARSMLTVAPGVLSGEVGVRRDVRTGEVVPGEYIVCTTFADHASLLRYAASEEHDAVHDWVRGHVVAEHVSLFDAGPVAR